MLIECNRCEMRGIACSDCVVSALLGTPGEAPDLDNAERRAIGVLADAGLISPLQLVVLVEEGADDSTAPDTAEEWPHDGRSRSATG